ncbi:hypothetical protein [Phenylobacterium sp.]|uniref:hypothetical protein n=1 Tax=Phenylobacterium sp. TaxID=1871053 RepID=UPI002DE3B512|nr:hypothetical protein [Phenylobacterium sp.]
MSPDELHVMRAVRDEDFPILFTFTPVVEKLKASNDLLLGPSGLWLSDRGRQRLERAEAAMASLGTTHAEVQAMLTSCQPHRLTHFFEGANHKLDQIRDRFAGAAQRAAAAERTWWKP